MDTNNMLQFAWLDTIGPFSICSLIHKGSCSMQFVRKLTTVFKIGIKYYLLFHFVPFLFFLKKNKDQKKITKTIIKTFKNYLLSVLFMGFLVSGSKAGLCFGSVFPNYHLDGKIIAFNAVISGFSIFFEQGSRRNEISYFILSKALGSLYLLLKRVYGLSIKNESENMHIIFMALLYYVYVQHAQILKFRSIFDKIWAEE